MDPGVAHLEAFLASAGVRLDVFDLIEMRTVRHVLSVNRPSMHCDDASACGVKL
jgi:hypothetical protein